MTVLTIAQTAADELGIDRPTALVGSTDPDSRQMLALLNREGSELVARYEWAACIRQEVVTLVSAQQNYQVPATFQRIIDDTMWDVTNRWPLIGPLSSEEWEMLQRGIIVSTPRMVWRLIGQVTGTYANAATPFYVAVMPIPSANGAQFSYEYLSNGFARQNSDTVSGSFDNDSDNPILPENLFILGLIWRWKRAKGLPYDEEFKTYSDARDAAIAQDKGHRKLSLTGQSIIGPRLITYDNVPETGFGSP